ncbi:MAG: VWA domain-containing protein [Thiotrichaceae bacterium]|nr:VWA domain-containing protein [Thiotrichaceae bacterium]
MKKHKILLNLGKNLGNFLLITGLASFSFNSAAREAPQMHSKKATQIHLQADLSAPIMLSGQKDKTFIKVSLTGFKLDSKADRTPANIAIVLDRSGSMNGEKMKRAKEAALLAVDLLNKNDILSIIGYDTRVGVLVPATKVSDKKHIKSIIQRIRADGSTALFAGVSKGAGEIRKFLDKERINRIILLSDGQANQGPSSPSELGQLGAALSKEGMSVTTIGLGVGYNEDLMTQLAGYSDGNHAFVENAADLAKVFQYEFGDVLSVVAQDVMINITLSEGVKPIRLLGREGDIKGNIIKTRLNQLYSEQEKYILLEVEIPEGKAKEIKAVASVKVDYQNMRYKKREQLDNQLSVTYSAVAKEVKQAINQPVVIEATKQVVNEYRKKAVKLRDKGQRKEAGLLLSKSVNFIKEKNSTLDSKNRAELNVYSEEISNDAEDIVNTENWNKKRKSLKAREYKLEKQQKY